MTSNGANSLTSRLKACLYSFEYFITLFLIFHFVLSLTFFLNGFQIKTASKALHFFLLLTHHMHEHDLLLEDLLDLKHFQMVLVIYLFQKLVLRMLQLWIHLLPKRQVTTLDVMSFFMLSIFDVMSLDVISF